MISFIGAGKVGTALGVYFKQKGCEIAGYYSRTHLHALVASELTDSKAFTNIEELLQQSTMVWITVTDDSLETVAKEVAQLNIPSNVKAFVHTSGVHSSDVLQPIRDVGFPTYCAHPLMAFGEINESVPQLNDAYFSLESPANKYLTCFFEKTGNHILQIDAEKKELYHCAASVLSNYMVTLLNLSYEMFAASGMTKSEIKKATAPLLNSTLRNIVENENMSEALTGAIKRGDMTTVLKHIEALENFMPTKTTLYRELGKETMEMLKDYRLKEIL